MIQLDDRNRTAVIGNGNVEVMLRVDHGLWLKKLGLPAQSESLRDDIDIFRLEIEGDFYSSSSFEIVEITHHHDSTEEMISVSLVEKSTGFQSRLCLINEADNELRLIIQLAIDWQDGVPKETYIHLPFLSAIHVGKGEPLYLFPSNPVSKRDGTSIVQFHKDFPMPLGIMDVHAEKGLVFDFPTLNEPGFLWAQNRNPDLYLLGSQHDLLHHRILIRPGTVLTDIFDITCSAIDQGWTQYFELWRDRVRSRINLSEYLKEDLQWSKDLLLHHFTYTYGKETYNYEENQVALDRLIEQGNEFGGYDSILLWHQYPRLGVDKRTQWDFFDDFPGGVVGLRKIVDHAHQYNIKVFLPFKPWDVGYNESPESATHSIASLIEKTDIDGIFLDTMDSVPKYFRDAINSVKPGVIFCSEAHPYRLHNLEIITSSWDQYWNAESMPEIDLLRYVMPEHVSPIIARWHVGFKKDMLIQRAIFNGTGIVIWQDVFGSWLPYSMEQKMQIKHWKRLWREHHDSFTCSLPIPLYPTSQEGVYCNVFPADNGIEVIVTFYNYTEELVSGELAKTPSYAQRIVNLWDETAVSLVAKQGNQWIYGAIPAKSVIVYQLLP